MLRTLLALLLWLPLVGGAADELLEPEQAFRLSARALDPATVEVRFDIAPGYYLYGDKFRFAARPDGVRPGPAVIPPGKVKDDEYFGRVETHRGQVLIRLPVEAPAGTDAFELDVTSQGCADLGVCYPPTTQTAKIRLAGGPAGGGAAAGLLPGAPAQSRAPWADAASAAASAAPPGAPTAGARADGDESSRLAGLLRHAGFWVAITTFFGLGVLLALTPCVLPMVPILSGIVVGHGQHVGKGRALLLSLTYVLAMAVVYAAAGVAAGLSGTMLAAALQNPWVLGGFALVFVALALSMFGFYELQLPAALQSRASAEAGRHGGSLAGVAAMGAISAVIVGPCVAAPLAGALLYIAQTGDAVLGGAALFAMALGMGAPLIAVGVSAGALMPKLGGWMEAVKKAFGVVMLAVALWLVSPVIPALAQMLGWAALLLFCGIYLHALDPLPPGARGWARFWKGVGVAALITGGAMLLGALAGSRDPLQPLAVLRAAAAPAEVQAAPAFERVADVAQLDARLKSAGRPVMLDFYADWCVSCKEMERFTFADPQVRARMKDMLLLQVDVTANSADDKALLARFGLFGPPGIIFFDREGREIQGLRAIGYMPAERFVPLLDRALGA